MSLSPMMIIIWLIVIGQCLGQIFGLVKAVRNASVLHAMLSFFIPFYGLGYCIFGPKLKRA